MHTHFFYDLCMTICKSISIATNIKFDFFFFFAYTRTYFFQSEEEVCKKGYERCQTTVSNSSYSRRVMVSLIKSP